MTTSIAIIGASLAGGRAALALRDGGFDGRVALVGAEEHAPYERPPLSKEVLLGTAEPTSSELVDRTEYDLMDIDLVLGVRAVELRPADAAVILDDGQRLSVDRVLLATGSQPRPLDLPGGTLDGVHLLRTRDDAVALRDALVEGAQVVVIGAGFIGAEVAAVAVQRGCDVALVEVAQLPLQRVLGSEFGLLYADMHRANGVSVHLNARPAYIEGDRHCTGVVLENGRRLPAQVVVCGIGVTPATQLAEAAGLHVDNGVVVDEYCRTSSPAVYAAGDVASRPSSYATGRIRLESWQNAQNHGMAAAAAMLGGVDGFDDLPWFWSDQYDVNLQLAGVPGPTDLIVWRGARDSLDCTAFYLRDDVVTAAVGLNRPREVRAAMDLIKRRVAIPHSAQLADESVDLRALGKRAPVTVK